MDIAKNRNGELKNILDKDNYMSCAVRECYASIKNLIYTLVIGESDEEEYVSGNSSYLFWSKLFLGEFWPFLIYLFSYRLVKTIFESIDDYIYKGTLLTHLNLSDLPDLLGHFVNLTEYVVSHSLAMLNISATLKQERNLIELSILATAEKQKWGQESDC